MIGRRMTKDVILLILIQSIGFFSFLSFNYRIQWTNPCWTGAAVDVCQ
jgi:hypothetical protein